MHHDAYFPPKLQHKQYTASVEALSLHKIRPRRTKYMDFYYFFFYYYNNSTTLQAQERGCKLKIAGPLIEYGFGAALWGEKKQFSVLCSNKYIMQQYYTTTLEHLSTIYYWRRNFALKFKFKINTYAFLMQFCRAQKLNFSKIKALLNSLDDGWLG